MEFGEDREGSVLREVDELEMEGVRRMGGGGGLPPKDLRKEPVREPE